MNIETLLHYTALFC